MDYQLPTQLPDPDAIRGTLKKLSVPPTFCSQEFEVLLVYLADEAGQCCHKEFFKQLKSNILHNFVFSCQQIENKLGLEKTLLTNELYKIAARKLSQHTAKGELGELLLFTLLDVYFKAPKLLSKISMKTSRRMPVFGADAVHGQFVNGTFRIYLGESKLHKNFTSAGKKAVESIESASDKYTEEFDLLTDHINFPGMEDDAKKAILNVIDPFSDANAPLDYVHSPCFIGFADPELFDSSNNEQELKDAYEALAEKYCNDFSTWITNSDIEPRKTALILLPFQDIDKFVQEFINHAEIEA